MNSRILISVMICTKERAQDVKDLLGGLAEQTCRPDQVVVVDASRVDELSDHLAAAAFPFECRYLRSEPGVMRQRNIGVAHCQGEFIFCLDDDVLPAHNFIEEMLKPLRQATLAERDLLSPRLGAPLRVGVPGHDGQAAEPPNVVIGRIVDDRSWITQASPAVRINYALRSLINEIFLLDKAGSGRFRYSGFATYSREEGQSRFVECIPGGCVVYRRHIFDQFRFDENFFYPLVEDMDTSKRLLDAGHRVYYQASARVLHKKSPGGRLPRYNLYQALVTYYHYMFSKNWPQTPLRKLAFWWSILGLLIINLSRPEQFKGVLSGIAHIRAYSSPLEAMRRLAPNA